MPESVNSRLARILTGVTHALVEKAENLAPEAVMKQSIRDIEQVIAEVRVELGKAEAAKHLVQSQLSALENEHQRLTGQIDIALSEQRDDLAASALGRQADIEDFSQVLKQSLEEQNQRAKNLENDILELQAKKKEFENILSGYLVREGNQPPEPVEASLDRKNTRRQRLEEAEAAFNRVLATELGVSGLTANSAADAAKLKELVELERNRQIAERLAALKAAKSS